MKPIKLEIAGLQSFEEKQVIDFEHLTEYGLFGIFGPTGSGKSTVLDAITLAIYGEVVRIKSASKDDTIDDLLNINSKEIFIDFEFAIGTEIYRIQRRFKRKRSERKIGSKKVLMTKGNEVIADKIKEVNNEVNRIIGLTMDDFTRSVVLPQGKFSEFLKLSGAERRSMLERLFDLEAYGKKLIFKVRNKRKEHLNQINAIDNQIKGKGDINPEEVSNITKDLEKYQKEKLELDKMNKEINEKYQRLNELAELDKKLKDIKLVEEEVKGKRGYILELEDTIKDINLAKGLDEKHQSYFDELQLYNERHGLHEGLVEKSKIEGLELEKTQELYKSKSNEKNDITTELDKIKLSSKELDQLAIVKLQKDSYLKKIKSIEGLKLDIDQLEDDISQLNKTIDKDMLHIQEVELEIKEVKEVEDKEIFDLEKEVLALDMVNLKKLIDNIEEKKQDLQGLNKESNQLNDKIKEVEELNKAARLRERELWAHKLSSTLEPHSPCPVCGSHEHPHLAKKVNLDDNRDYSQDLIELKSRLNSIDIEQKQGELDKLIKELDNRDYNEILKIEVKLKDEITRLKRVQNESRIKKEELIKSLEKVQKSYDTNKLKLIRFEEKLLSLREKDIKEKVEVSEILASLGKINLDFIVNNRLKLDTIEIYIDNLNQKIVEVENYEKQLKGVELEVNQIQNLVEDKKIKYDKLLLEQKSLEGEIKNISINREKREKIYLDALRESKFDSIEDIKGLLLKDFESITQEINQYKKLEIETHKTIALLEENLAGRVFDEEELGLVKVEVGKVKVRIEEVNNILGSLTSQKEQIEKIIDEVEELLIERRKIEKIFETYEDLAKLFEGNKFVEYLALSKIRNIARIASRRLATISNGRYALTTDKVGNFLIIDNFNGGESRRSATLSGGESFLVSLSLALALSSQIQLKGASQLEFFFLDEGFGTLDNELLDKVITSLESLRDQEGMKVGIITHVDELKERVPRKVEVTPASSGEHGSLIKIV